MKTYAKFGACSLVAIAASVLWGLGSTWGQDDPAGEESKPRPVTVRGSEKRSEMSGGYGAVGFGSPYSGAFRRGGYGEVAGMSLKVNVPHESLHAIRDAATALSEAEDDEPKTEAQEKLMELLDEYFEQDMQRREEELAKVEERVKRLRELLERRREKKEDIIELQREVLVNEAEGLGFFSGGGQERRLIPATSAAGQTYMISGEPAAAPAEPPVPPARPRPAR